jgi:hypothetical protein
MFEKAFDEISLADLQAPVEARRRYQGAFQATSETKYLAFQ